MVNLLEKRKKLGETISLAQEREELIAEWEDSEVRGLFAAESFEDCLSRPGIFSLKAMIAIVFSIIAILPGIILSFYLYNLGVRRNRKIKSIVELDHKIRSTYPILYKPSEDFVPEEYIKYMEILRKEGIVYTHNDTQELYRSVIASSN